MAADEKFLGHVMELLAGLGDVGSRAMSGGYGIFHQDASMLHSWAQTSVAIAHPTARKKRPKR